MSFPPHAELRPEVKRDALDQVVDRSFNVKPKGPRVFEATLSTCKPQDVSWENVGGHTVGNGKDWDAKTGLHKKGFMKLSQSWIYTNDAQSQAISLGKPAIVAAKCLQLKKGVMVRLI